MIGVAVIGILVLVLIYVLVRAQGLNREIKQYKHNLKIHTAQEKYLLKSNLFMAKEIQGLLLNHLNKYHNKGIMSEAEFTLKNALLNCIAPVAVDCFEHNMTVEEALTRTLEGSPYDIDDIRNFIKDQPTQITLAWSKGTLSGFIAACKGLTFHIQRANTQPEDTAPNIDD